MQDDTLPPASDAENSPAWLPERLERARRLAVQQLLDQLGVESVEVLQARLADHTTQLEALSAERDTWQAQAEQATAIRQQTLIETAFQLASQPYDFFDRQEARALVDLTQVSVADDGTVQGIEDALADLVATRPHLLRRRRNFPTDMGASGDRPQIELSDAAVAAIKKRFRLE